MAESDWTVAEDSPDINTIKRGNTAGIDDPPGGDGFVYGFNSRVVVEGASAIFYNGEDFAPYEEGASIRAAIQKGASGGVAGYTPLLFLGLQGNSVNDDAYMLCLQNNNPARLLLVKGPLSTGPAGTVLRTSDATFAIGEWMHLRLDAIVNGNGDVVLAVRKNNLATNELNEAPVWEAVAGMGDFVDDQLAVNSGSDPLVGGRAGVGMWTTEVTRRAYMTHVELIRQVPA
jgi:hypothetical protein